MACARCKRVATDCGPHRRQCLTGGGRSRAVKQIRDAARVVAAAGTREVLLLRESCRDPPERQSLLAELSRFPDRLQLGHVREQLAGGAENATQWDVAGPLSPCPLDSLLPSSVGGSGRARTPRMRRESVGAVCLILPRQTAARQDGLEEFSSLEASLLG